jgi:hypothetical protein
VFQPAAFGAGVTEAVIVGGVVVVVTLRFTELAIPPGCLAVIVEVPLANPAAKPFELMVATFVLEELQFTELVKFWTVPS